MKQFFFKEKQPVNLLKEYDAIGFSDCLIKYKVEPVRKMIVETHLRELVDRFNYPKELLDFDFEANNHTKYCIENAVWDIATGVILKLDENFKILAAICGF